MATVGVPSSIAGMTFSPHRTDAGTGFGRMQISSWQGANLYEVPLTPAGGGIFTPGNVTLFVTLPQQGTGAIQYVPSGPLTGNLMYVNYNFGEVRVLTIHPATGLPIDKGTGQPTLGTTNPTDSRFASGLGVGPWGLEFDPRTNDFFVATFNGDPANSIVQIGGAGFPPPTKTTATYTTTTSTSTTTTTNARDRMRRPRGQLRVHPLPARCAPGERPGEARSRHHQDGPGERGHRGPIEDAGRGGRRHGRSQEAGVERAQEVRAQADRLQPSPALAELAQEDPGRDAERPARGGRARSSRT